MADVVRSEAVKPALTPEEWAWYIDPDTIRARWADDDPEWALSATRDELLQSPQDFIRDGIDLFRERGDTFEESRHRTAAICLYGQPFGFTWENVDNLAEAQCELLDYTQGDHDVEFQAIVDGLRATIDRIAALLPPRER